MKRILLIYLFIFFAFNAFNQIGIKAAYLSSDFSNIERDIISDSRVDIFSNGFMTGLYYSIGINGKGINLLPEIGIGFYNSIAALNPYKLQQIFIGVPVKFYPLNLEGDCGCPDFSLRNKFFEKHFFMFFNNAVFYNGKSMTNDENQVWDNYFSFKIGLGAGITIPLTQIIRVEPFLSYNWGFNDKWVPAMLNGERVEAKSINYTQSEFGIRLGVVIDR